MNKNTFFSYCEIQNVQDGKTRQMKIDGLPSVASNFSGRKQTGYFLLHFYFAVC